ncbi:MULTISPECIES: alpha/beta hydrolase [Streptomyces]|uniref:Alpha/beta fold hydrolase n=1 Tax=Streptomyces caniscabiei TaxID=2746961 RepID=A0ABU4MTF1_9ACTN|nr:MULTISPECIES: alpha/beta hydrolase [Streptomyces]MBE4737538.1 alpha/beta fold hydrolase [Streptomyces caniscabiei]MBE4756298.1 alpha/beta fold hydrolase [Streptomyces caniscabiei]MBE4769685.1 alpha/beta fold hydrolase [Streptomyces caniscabiei]MBE4787369.1 alpha/beta fold hydrolase [Streptomyces caniscabiei]MBE4795226.1 alpha/beta fold hydrolase [Streptomyces caniscabiei]
MRSTHRRRPLTGAAVAVLALLGAGLPALTAGADDEQDDGRADLSRFYDQKIKWSKCEGMEMPRDLRCGKVTVPLDYSRPRAGTLDLALARYRATGDSRGSLLLNFGGPGGPGVPELAYGGEDFMDLTKGYDVVTFDPRGVGRSSPVSCGEGTDEALEATDGGEDTDDPKIALDRLRRAAAECRENSGPVLPHIGTLDAARDLDVMRAALGDKKLNYLGFSYGTRLGAVYAAQFPGKVGRMALDGVDTLTEPLTEQNLVAAQGQQTALENYLDACTEELTCPFGQDSRSAREQVVALVDSLDENPVPSDFGQDFTGQDLVGAIGHALYSEQLWPMLTQALNMLVHDGDTRGVMALSGGGFAPPATPYRAPHRTPQRAAAPARPHEPVDPTPSGSPTPHEGLVDIEEIPLDNLPAALMAINCADDPDRPTAKKITDDLADLRAAYEDASPVFGRYRLTQVLMCYGRPAGTDFIRDEVRDVDTPKMLLVGTRGDPATPYRWTVETAKRLGSSAVVLDNKGKGHTGYGSSKCVHDKVDDFLLFGTLPDDGSSCGVDD